MEERNHSEAHAQKKAGRSLYPPQKTQTNPTKNQQRRSCSATTPPPQKEQKKAKQKTHPVAERSHVGTGLLNRAETPLPHAGQEGRHVHGPPGHGKVGEVPGQYQPFQIVPAQHPPGLAVGDPLEDPRVGRFGQDFVQDGGQMGLLLQVRRGKEGRGVRGMMVVLEVGGGGRRQRRRSGS